MNAYRNYYRWHFRREWRRILALSLAAATFVALMVAISDAVEPADMQQIFDKIPPAMAALIGLDPGALFTLERWVAIAHNHPVWLVLILVFPLAAAQRGIAHGVDDGTLELVLAQPASRTSFFLALLSVLLAGVTVVLSFSVLGGVAASCLVELPGDVRASTLARFAISGWALALSVAGMSALAAAAGAGRGKPGTWAVSAVVFFFFARFLAGIWPAARWIGPYSIFHYHDPQRILAEGLQPTALIVLLGLAVACSVAGLLVFRRRQLTF